MATIPIPVKDMSRKFKAGLLLAGVVGAFAAVYTVVHTSKALTDTRFFDVNCHASHQNNDDPLKFYGQQGVSHRHQFFGSNSTDYQSTGATLLASNTPGVLNWPPTDPPGVTKGTTCYPADPLPSDPLARRDHDGTAQWFPVLYTCPTADAIQQISACTEVVPNSQGMHGYYFKRGTIAGAGCTPTAATTPSNPGQFCVRPFPTGFGQIAGQGINHDGDLAHDWECLNGTVKKTYVLLPDGFVCGDATHTGKLRVTVHFAECWNGTDLFKLDESHVAYTGTQGAPIKTCPNGFFLMPDVNLQDDFTIPADGTPRNYRLAFTTTTATTTDTAHADYFAAWDPDVLAHLVDQCLNANVPAASICNVSP